MASASFLAVEEHLVLPAAAAGAAPFDDGADTGIGAGTVGIHRVLQGSEEGRDATLVRRGDDRLPARNALDMLGEPLGDRTEFGLGAVDAGHAADATHTKCIERVGRKTVLAVDRPHIFDRVSEDRPPEHRAAVMPVPARVSRPVTAFRGPDAQPLQDRPSAKHRKDDLQHDGDGLQLLRAELRHPAREPALGDAEIEERIARRFMERGGFPNHGVRHAEPGPFAQDIFPVPRKPA